jgi:hypothetical protein
MPRQGCQRTPDLANGGSRTLLTRQLLPRSCNPLPPNSVQLVLLELSAVPVQKGLPPI